ncbi:acyl-CoA dehydrogenase [Actinobacteria bacterium YIM 96077]|uniref:Acyl-CoA dehydrogenase n=1 Tax=Phytoactinopolyspora halophila TaxID=1981511 RepID=A0A329R095_9ACTN|nr:acyl-CoA dehydrogenase family protein [Phytoactinopolyspora halophila]AYY11506.1 acyl-CoA dehydrogenase [Actinobacteria bacterium YIM 96077]RAW18011.1 acyl-CoA dehydrogenase [Phytoactinopolyspora halophila]
MPVARITPTPEVGDLFTLVRDIGDAELRPRADPAEASGDYPRDVLRLIGRSGLLGLPYDDDVGGGAQPYEVYLQVLEELAMRWATVALGVSVHTLACWPLAAFGTAEQRKRWLPDMVSGELSGAYCLSEPHAGSDAAALSTRAVRDGEHYVLTGTKAWVTHGGQADFYTVFARTSDGGSRGISCFLVPADAGGLSFGTPERKMGLNASPTTLVYLDEVRVPTERRLGDEGDGFGIALQALDSGRLGIAAIATGLGQAALEASVSYAKEREQFGQPIITHQGVGFMLADMAAAVESARALYLTAASRRDAGLAYRHQASVAKLVATDNAMRVTTDAVQVFGGAGYVRDYPVERYFREAKVMQIFEGTNQIQRLVIARDLERNGT